MRQLAKQHAHKLLPTAKPLGVALRLVVFDCTRELTARKQLQKLRVHTAYLNHGWSSLLSMWSCPGTHFRVTVDQPPQTFLGANRISRFGQQCAMRCLLKHNFRVAHNPPGAQKNARFSAHERVGVKAMIGSP